jgi:fucose 4-O-acetylase-like acetyltransferase
MGPLRVVLFFLWFSALFYLIEKHQAAITKRTRGIVELIGRNSLFVYITHAFVVFIFQLFIPNQTNIFQNFLITGAALAILIAITLVYRPLRTDWAETHSFSLRSIIAKTKAELAG